MKKGIGTLLLAFVMLGVTGCKDLNQLAGDIQSGKAFKKETASPNSSSQNVKPEQKVQDNKAQAKKEAERREWMTALGLTPSADFFGKQKNDRIISTWKSAGATPKEAKKWADIGFSAKQYARISKVGFSAEEAKNWADGKFKLSQAVDWRDAGFSAHEARKWKDKGYENPFIAKAERSGAASLNQEECEAIFARMVEKNGKKTCDYKPLKWSDVKLCSVRLKKTWRREGYTPWETKQWTDAGVILPDMDMRTHNSFIQYLSDSCKKLAKDSAYTSPEDWSSPSAAVKIIRVGLRNEKEYNAWIKAGYSRLEIKEWVNLGVKKPSQAKILTNFGMTIKTVPRYVAAGVRLDNLDDYKGMTLEEIEAEYAEANARYAKQKEAEAKAQAKKDAETRKKIKLIQAGKKYSCGLLKLSYGNNIVTLYDGFYGALEDELVYVDKTNVSKKYIGNKYTVQIITDLKKAKKDLANAVIAAKGGFEMPVRCE